MKCRQLAHHQLLSQQGLILVHTEKLKPKGPIAKQLASSDISHVALASVLLGENPSEEVDNYDNRRASEASETLSGLFNRESRIYILEKWFPLQGERGHSSYFRCFQKQNREEGETEYKQQAYQFTQGYNILHRLQVHHPFLTFIIHNKYIHTYIHTYIYINFVLVNLY